MKTLLTLILLNIFSGYPTQGASSAANEFKLFSLSFKDKGPIPKKYTCQGENVTPELQWSGIPPGTKSLALIVDDPDAPDPQAPKMDWIHWVVYDIPVTVSKLGENGGGIQGLNDFNKLGYGGPCPPIGEHRYFFKLYALKKTLDLPPGKTKDELLKIMQGEVLGYATLMGTYKKN